MPSIIEGYSYDIFISYRQNDNRYDGWVTEFVDNLKKELEANIKDKVSVYFDINPTDGLLETDSVDKSLVDKLKCLIFIPIISRTYCDAKSFAWQHEFCAFNKLVKEDKFGRDIRLTSGNVASRILSVKIHDFDPEDKAFLENELGGVLRSIEFIYKSPGVNRPLTPSDNPDKNLNKTYYRDQINKVANAVKEIIAALKKQSKHPEEVTKQDFEVKSVYQKNQRSKILVGLIIVLILVVPGFLIIPKLLKSEEPIEKSIAVLPFKLLSDEPDKQYLADGMMDAILLHLSKIKDLRVMSRTSVEQYKGTTKTTHQIGKELDVAYLLEGSFQKFGDNARLIVQLIKASEESHTWANEYNRKWGDFFSVQSEVAQTIAKELYTTITPEEIERIEKIPTANMTAYDLYLKANNYLEEYRKTYDLSYYHTAVNLYKTALEMDSAFALAYTGMANTYYRRYFYESYFKEGFLDSCLILVNKALSFDDKLDEAYYIKGMYYQDNGDLEKAMDNYDKAIKNNPNYFKAYNAKGYLLTWIINDYVKGIDNYHKALNLIHGDERQGVLNRLGNAYLEVGFIEKVKYYLQEALALDSNQAAYFNSLAWIEFNLEHFEEALQFANKASEIDSTSFIDLIVYSIPPGHNEEAYLIANKMIDSYKKSGALNLQGSHRIGYAFWKVSKKKEAENYFNQQIKYGEESIKLSRDIEQRKAAQYDLAATYAFIGDKENAYKYLDECIKKNTFPLWWVSLAKHDPLFNNIRKEERFQKILQNMEAKYQAEHERVKKWLEEQGML